MLKSQHYCYSSILMRFINYSSKLMSLVLLTFGLLACNPATEKNPEVTPAVKTFATDISGADFAQTLSLTDHQGKSTKLSDFKGKVVLLFFGYTHCPDVCPTTMNDVNLALKKMGEKANQVQVLFVTLDPARDTQQVLAKFVPSFNKSFIGLRGDEQQTAETAKNFKIFYSKQAETGQNDYSIDHSAGLYAFDKLGKIKLYINYGQKPDEIAHDLSVLL